MSRGLQMGRLGAGEAAGGLWAREDGASVTQASREGAQASGVLQRELGGISVRAERERGH